MDLMTISEVTKAFNISTRMLRYYDEIGLLRSKRKDDYAYRAYDESAVKRLQQIITLRKLRIPLKKIALIFNDTEQAKIVEVLQESMNELEAEVSALQTIRDVLRVFIQRLNSMANASVELNMLGDDEIMSVIQTLSLSKINFKEERSMDDLNKANEALSTVKDCRIIYLPPSAVASSYYFGDDPESNAEKPLAVFIRSIGLKKIKPDLRQYGFNNPTPKGNETYGYEFWVTIPDDLEIPAPLVKKRFAGGLYAAHCIKMGDFHEWKTFYDWIHKSTDYEYEEREPSGMCGALEEHINAYSYYCDDAETAKFIQVDLLIPIRIRR